MDRNVVETNIHQDPPPLPAVLEALIKANALNQTGNVDYNKYGKLDGIGLKSYLTSLWIIFYFVYLYQITTQRRKRRLEEIILLGVKIVRLENCVENVVTPLIPRENLLN